MASTAVFYLPNGKYTLTASNGTISASKQIIIWDSGRTLTLTLSNTGGSGTTDPDEGGDKPGGGDQGENDTINVGGFLVDETDKNGIVANYTVCATDDPNKAIIESTTGITGVFEFDVPAGEYTITFVGDGFEPLSISFSVEAGQKTMTFGLIYVSLNAASGKCGDNLKWVLSNDGTLTISGTGSMYSYGVYVDDGSYWKDYKDSIQRVIIKNGVTSIGGYAFSDCTNLTSVSILGRMERIGGYAFWKCSNLVDINIPVGIVNIEEHTFDGCANLDSVNIPDSVTAIGDYVFDGCESLTDVVFSGDVTNIGSHAFYGCSNLYLIATKSPS